MKKIFIIFLVFILSGISNIYAIFVSPKIEKIYVEKIVAKIEKKYSSLKEKISVLENLGKKIGQVKKIKKYRDNKNIQNILDQILYLNNLQINRYKKELVFLQLKEKLKESKKVKENIKEEEIVKESIDENKKEVQKNYTEEKSNEYTENIYEKKFLEEQKENKKIIDSYSYSKYFKNKVYSKNLIFKENGIWYGYIYNTYTYFSDNTNIGLRDLEYNGINVNKAVIFVTDKKTLGILKNPVKRRLISDNIISNLKNKYYFLKLLRDDVKNLKNDINYDRKFLELKAKSRSLTYSLTRESKILNIYNFILKNISYSKIIDFSNYKIFSGIETYINREGVCVGYAKLMIYMLLFSDINDVEGIKGYVIDAEDFPDVGHAWLKIGDKYYDPTFDDPTGAEDDKEFGEYKYFGLPKDLFYVNRFEPDELPEYIKKLSLKDRKNIVRKNLYDIYPKYKYSNYNILKEIKFRIEHNFKYNEDITFYNFSKIIPKKVVHDFVVYINGKKRYISSLRYYPIDENTDFDALLEQLDYNLDGYYFFEWYDENGNKSYKLAYNVKF